MEDFHNPPAPREFAPHAASEDRKERTLLGLGTAFLLVLVFAAGFMCGRASAQTPQRLTTEQSLEALLFQIAAQDLKLQTVKAHLCIRQFPFQALTVHDGCLHEVSSFNGPMPQFILCRDKDGKPVCGVGR